MNASSTQLPYRVTGYFSAISTDYIVQEEGLQDFYMHPPTAAGIAAAIQDRDGFSTDRRLLHDTLKNQYAGMELPTTAAKNIERLLLPGTYTICTAHQPNIFTGHLYFIYKIIHAIRLADHLNVLMPGKHFVPVYYMGSEDADLDELGEITVNGTHYQWQTDQTGAVGRMLVDDALLQILDTVTGELVVQPHGPALVDLIQHCYTKGSTIEQATFRLVHALFAEYGLLVFLPDSAVYKQKVIDLFTDDILNHTAAGIVKATSERLELAYKAQAFPRDINLFYLKDNIRERIEETGDHYTVHQQNIRFTREELLEELHTHPERFSPNVILRGLFQETLLPNIAFIGGGGELAYWLQLKDLFVHYKVPYPVQVLRNSFLLMNSRQAAQWDKLGFSSEQYFLSEDDLLNTVVKRESENPLQLEAEKKQLAAFYDGLYAVAGKTDFTLQKHTEALKVRALKKLDALEKKMLRAEKRKFETEQRHIHTLKQQLFPGKGLQERVENMMPFYAQWGPELIRVLYNHSLPLEQQFTILEIGE